MKHPNPLQPARRLALRREHLRTLSPRALAHVIGGVAVIGGTTSRAPGACA
jgi:hypothetical protein